MPPAIATDADPFDALTAPPTPNPRETPAAQHQIEISISLHPPGLAGDKGLRESSTMSSQISSVDSSTDNANQTRAAAHRAKRFASPRAAKRTTEPVADDIRA